MPSIIHDLKNPESLPDRTETVSVVQTHISIVFVADEWVYKIKKPVNFGFLDFSTLEKRKHYCHQEVRLNKRLAEDIYRDVLPVTFDGKKFTLKDGPGELVDYAVKMKRIPDEILMNSLFEKGKLTRENMKTVADILARFHFSALKNPEIDKFGEPEMFRVNTDENFEQVRKYVDVSLPKHEFDALKKWTNDFYKANRELFFQRIREGKIRDCHGDLHMEHICFTKDLSIIDCIEFNDRFRYSDTVADIAFLLMDLEYHGGKNEAADLWNYYKGFSNEGEVESLLIFYKVYRAFVRGKVNSFQVDDEIIDADKKDEAVQRARKYFQLAFSYI